MNTAEDWAVIAYHVVSVAVDRLGEDYVKTRAAEDPYYLDYRRGLN